MFFFLKIKTLEENKTLKFYHEQGNNVKAHKKKKYTIKEGNI